MEAKPKPKRRTATVPVIFDDRDRGEVIDGTCPACGNSPLLIIGEMQVAKTQAFSAIFRSDALSSAATLHHLRCIHQSCFADMIAGITYAPKESP